MMPRGIENGMSRRSFNLEPRYPTAKRQTVRDQVREPNVTHNICSLVGVLLAFLLSTAAQANESYLI